MTFVQKLLRKKQAATNDKNASTNDDKKDGKKQVVISNRWNRLYYGFDGFDPLKPPSTEKKQKNVVLSKRDLDFIDYCNAKIISDKSQIHILQRTNESLMRDHRYKDHEIRSYKREIRSVQKMYQRQLVEQEYNEKEWAIEKKQLLAEIESLRGTSIPQEELPEDDPSMESLEEDCDEMEEGYQEAEDLRREGLSRRSSEASSSSVRDLIEKFNNETGRYLV